jgi:hypothetical protein
LTSTIDRKVRPPAYHGFLSRIFIFPIFQIISSQRNIAVEKPKKIAAHSAAFLTHLCSESVERTYFVLDIKTAKTTTTNPISTRYSCNSLIFLTFRSSAPPKWHEPVGAKIKSAPYCDTPISDCSHLIPYLFLELFFPYKNKQPL